MLLFSWEDEQFFMESCMCWMLCWGLVGTGGYWVLRTWCHWPSFHVMPWTSHRVDKIKVLVSLGLTEWQVSLPAVDQGWKINFF